MFDSISNLIGSGTGVNSGQLVADLLAASREPKLAILQNRQQTNGLKISALASASASLDTFTNALTGLLNGRAFAGDLVSSQPALASVGFVDGARPQGLPATLEILQIASARRMASAPVTDSNFALGAGTMTISNASGSFDIILTPGADSLADLVDAINQAGAGVSAAIMNDNDGARLILEGQNGADQAFTVSGDFTDYNYPSAGAGMTLISEAADALVKIDGVDLRYSGNNIENAIQGISINLKAASPGTFINISGDQPTTTIANLVTEFVDAYNQLRTALNNATTVADDGSGGLLAADAGVRDMIRSLGQIGATRLVDSGPYRALSDIGVKTGRDGTLSIDRERLDAVLENDPDAVSNMLDPLVADDNNPGIAGVLQSIRDRLQGDNGPLKSSQARLEQIKTDIAKAWEKLDADSERYEAQLKRSFATMDRQLVLLKATQTYLTQQIAIWNGGDD